MKVIVTGSNSVIGEHLCKKMTESGANVLKLGGRNSDVWKLGEMLPSSLKADCLVHLAHDRTSSLAKNVENGYLLCNSFAGRKIFLSTLSAHSLAKSRYGISKFNLEKIFLEAGGVVLRAGYIYGAEGLGISGKLNTLVRKFPIIPIPYMGRPIFYETHIDDLINEIFLSVNENQSGVIFAANSLPIRFDQLLKNIASSNHVQRIFIRFPTAPLDKYIELLSKKFPNVSMIDSLLSLSVQTSQTEMSEMAQPKTIFRGSDDF
jgi:nucleoside-diphosphate-sugar epimerase